MATHSPGAPEGQLSSELAHLHGELLFRSFLDKLPSAAYTCDPQGLITYFNKRAVQLWGREPKLNDPVDRYCGSYKLISRDGAPCAHQDCWMAHALRTERDYNGLEIIVERPDGQRITVQANANLLRDETGMVIGGINVLLDITDRKEAVRLIKEKERFGRAILDSLGDHIAVLDQRGTIIAVNDAWEAFAAENAGNSAIRLGVGLNYLDACRSASGNEAEDARAALAGIEAVLRGDQAGFALEYSCHSFDEKRWFLMNVTPLFRDERGAVVAHVNITERRLAHEAHLRLIEQLLSAQEDERRRVALDLHDDVGQALTALLLGLAAAQEPPTTSEVSARLANLRAGIAGTLDSVRRLARGLRPSALDDLGLGAALKRYVSDFEEAHRIPVLLDLPDPGLPRWPGRLEIAFYRIVQEALTNVAKHARARQIAVILEQRSGTACLTVWDGGRGFASTSWEKRTDDGKHAGLSGIRERASLLGGSVALESAPSQGTTLVVTIPLQARNS